jgi:hypothetical protein
MINFFKNLNKLRKKKRFQKKIEKKFLSPLEKKIKNFYKIYTYKKGNEISELCERHGSDKGYIDFSSKKPFGWKPHNYSIFYDDLFSNIKDKVELVFECGIGTNNLKFTSNMTETGKPGASLRVWKDYFKNANIYGADIDQDVLFKEERIETFYVDQMNENLIQQMWKNINKNNFDIIIDDGLHTFDAGVTLFNNSFSKLKKNGIYIIEDVHFSYLEKMTIELIDYEPKIVILKNEDYHKDNNLIVITKK